jgi:membrane protein DedA with SNARE-associated domain
MNLWRFLAFTFIGSAAWNVVLIGGGHLLADAFGASQKVMTWALVATAVVGVMFYLWRLATWKPRNAPAS